MIVAGAGYLAYRWFKTRRPGTPAEDVRGASEAELRVDLAGLHELVGVGLDARGGAQQPRRPRAAAGCRRPGGARWRAGSPAAR